MKTKFIFSLVFTFLFSSLMFAQTQVIIATIPVSGSTGTILPDLDDLKDAFNNEFSNGTNITSVSVEKLGSTWFLIGEGTIPGGGNISTAVLLSVSSGNATINLANGPMTSRSCMSLQCTTGCKIAETGCTPCVNTCDSSSGSLTTAGELGGFGFVH